MAESDRNHSSEMEARLDEKHHRWLRPEEICEVLRNPNRTISEKPAIRPPSITISEKPAIRPPSGSIFLFNKKKQKRFRKDGYKWKKAKGGKIVKEAHERLKVGGTETLHCYYAHGEEDTNFQRRSYWLIDENFSHMALVHYRNIKDQGDEIRIGEGVLHSPETNASAYNHQASSGLLPLPGLQHEIGSFSSNPSNLQHLQATDATNLNSAHTLEPENTVSAHNHQASSELPFVLGFQHAVDRINWDDINRFLADEDMVDTGTIPLHGPNSSNFGDDETVHINWESPMNIFTGLPEEDMVDTDTIPLHGPNSSTFGDDETACTNSRASSSVAVEPSHSSLGKRQCGKFSDSTKSKATPLATIEEVEEEEEGNDTNQARKRLKVTCGPKSQPLVPQPIATIGIATSAATNMTAAPESSNPALLQSRPTSDANQVFVQDVENQEQELEPTLIKPENGKSKAVVQNDFGTGKSHKFSEVAVMGSCKSLHELLDRASAPNTLASSSICTPTIDSQAIATIRATLEMDFTTMAGDVQRTDRISLIKSLVDSNCFPTGTRTMILSILNLLEQPLRAYSEYDKGKNLNDQVEATIKRLQPKVQFWDSKKRELQELEKLKMQIEADLAAIHAEINGAVKETEPIQAELKELLRQRDQFKENEGNLKTRLDIGDGSWATLKKVIPRYLPT